jgi:hypothetical protein
VTTSPASSTHCGAGATKVLVLDLPQAAASSAVDSVATEHGAVVIDTSSISTTGADGHQQIAAAIKTAAGIA